MNPVNLNISPSCPNCLAWSTDGILAIAAGEQTSLLVPKVSKKERDSDSPNQDDANEGLDFWHSIRILTGQFTFREWPVQDPLSYKHFSIGEEQSTSKVVSLEWSPEGLGKYRRCVLGVLTSNCVLSLWEAEYHPSEAGGWKRAGILNDALKVYFDKVLGEGNGRDEAEIGELKRRKRRIRAFAWSPEHHCESEDAENEQELRRIDHIRRNPQERRYHDPPWRIINDLVSPEIAKASGDDRKWGVFYMAISNDDNDMVFARLYKDCRTPGLKLPIFVDILSHINVSPSQPRNLPMSSEYSLSNVLAMPSHVRQISWGPWSHGDKSRGWSTVKERRLHNVALIGFLQGTTLRFCRVKLTEIRQDEWAKVGENEILFQAKLAVFVHKSVDLPITSFDGSLGWCKYRSAIPCDPAEDIEMHAGHINEHVHHYRLAVASGASVTLLTFPSNIYCHSHEEGEHCGFCDAEAKSEVVSLTLDISNRDLTSSHVGECEFQKVLWEREMNLAFTSTPFLVSGHEEFMLHVATTSSCAEIIKIAVPDTMEEIYGGAIRLAFDQSDGADWIREIRDAKDRFDREHDLGGLAVAKVWGLASNEDMVAACFTLHPGDMVEYKTAADEATTIVFSGPVTPDTMLSVGQWMLGATTTRLSDLQSLKALTDSDYELLEDKETRVIALTLVPWALFSVQSGTKMVRDPWSGRIIYNTLNYLRALELQWGTDTFARVTELKAMMQNAEKWLLPDDRVPAAVRTERCWCDAKLAEADKTYDVTCENGHTFRRCALTLVPILEPGISKFCSACDREYLDEEAFFERLHENSTEVEGGGAATLGVATPATFTNGLFWKMTNFFDTCPFCHGKYYTKP